MHESPAVRGKIPRNASPIQSTAKATTLHADPSYGFLPGSILDRDDLAVMDEIENDGKVVPNYNHKQKLNNIDSSKPPSQAQSHNPVTEQAPQRKITITGTYNGRHGASVLDELDDDF